MSFAQLLTDYGYLAVFAGSLLEGETILVLAGFAAHQGYLSLELTVAIAFVGGTLGDQVFLLELLPIDLRQLEGTALVLIVAVAVAFSVVRRWRGR